MPRRLKASFMLSTLTAHDDFGSRRKVLAFLFDDAIDLSGDGAEVAVLRIGVDIEDRCAVVVIDDDGQNRGRKRGHVTEQLAAVC